MNKPLKAYEVREPDEGNCVIAFATNSATARREGAGELGVEWEEVESCQRAPWADAYAPGPVPLHATLAAGWWHECGHCGCRFDSEGPCGSEPVERGTSAYCSETCAQQEWAARRARQVREQAVIDAAYLRFPAAIVIKAYETGHSKDAHWRATFTVPGLQYPVHWRLGATTVDVSQCDAENFKVWQQEQKQF